MFSARMIQIEENVSLAEYTTFRIGGPARYFVRVTSTEELAEALDFARENNLRIFILGGGSNILLADDGFSGLVIKIDILGIQIQKIAANHSKTTDVIVAGAGDSWDELVNTSINKGYSGLENLSGIPGTVGGAVVGNIGAYGREVKDALLWVDVLDSSTLHTKAGSKAKRLKTEECQFAYRDSIFKHQKNLIVVRAAFNTGVINVSSITYPDLLRYFAEHPSSVTPRAVRKAVLAIRAEKLPDISQLGTAGSFFKNPVISVSQYATLKKRYPAIPSFPVANAGQVKVPAAWLLDKICGFKGKRWGSVGVYERQALVLVNFGGATAADVAQRAREMTQSVKDATGIVLEPEVESVP